MEEVQPLFITIKLTLDDAAIINAALARYWLHTRNSKNLELRAVAPQVAGVQRNLVEHIRREGEKCHHATPERSQE